MSSPTLESQYREAAFKAGFSDFTIKISLKQYSDEADKEAGIKGGVTSDRGKMKKAQELYEDKLRDAISRLKK